MSATYKLKYDVSWRAVDLAVCSEPDLFALVGVMGVQIYALPEVDSYTSLRNTKPLKQLKTAMTRCAFSPDKRYLAVGGNTVKIFDVHQKFKTVASFKASKWKGISALCWSSDGALVAVSAGRKKQTPEIIVYDVNSNKELHRFEAKDFMTSCSHIAIALNHIAFSPDATKIGLAGRGCVSVYDLKEESTQTPVLPFSRSKDIVWLSNDEVAFRERVNESLAGHLGEPVNEDVFVTWKIKNNSVEHIALDTDYNFSGLVGHLDHTVCAIRLSSKDAYEGENGMCHDDSIWLRDIKTGAQERVVFPYELGEGQRIYRWSLSADHKLLAVLDDDGVGLIYGR